MFLDTDALDDDLWGEIADYLSEQATPATAAALQARIATDPIIANTIVPLRTLWQLFESTRVAARTPTSLSRTPEATARDAAQTAAAWARLDAALTSLAATPPAPAPVAHTPRQSRSIAPRVTPAAVPVVRPHTSRWRRPWVVTLGVACLLLLSAGVVFQVEHPAYQYTGGATGRVVTLPDHSIATLAPGAYLGTSHAFTYGTRAVYLFGQAHFQVAPNARRPFVVHVVGVQATALGTTFGMTSDTLAHVVVQVMQGKIALMVLGKDGAPHPALVLTAGQVQQIPALTQWMTEAGLVLGAAGVPFTTSIQIHNAMMRAAAALAAQPPEEASCPTGPRCASHP